MYKNTLTTAQKDKKIPIIIDRDGDVCIFDLEPFFENVPGMERTIDHLNDNEKDNRVENLALCHFHCNQKKKNDFDMKLIALDILRKNVNNASESLSECERKNHAEIGLDELKEGDVNKIINKIAKMELESKLPDGSDEVISYTKTIKNIHYLTIQQTGDRGSDPASRRAVDALCSSYAPFIDEKQGRGNRIIRRRLPEEVGN